ncbi:glycosyltransferase family 2 protein [Cyanobacteria bacterium FACHB-DQ100]|nr:glycosyltransferase family 2 protein [Cyanobacteria bacterium FACHB-DQ100]
MKSHLSLIVCTFNNCDLLRSCLNCLRDQYLDSKHSFEVLVVDNNSTDTTKQVVTSFIQDGLIPSLKYIFEPKTGLTNARLAGLSHSTSDWIAFIDDDVRIKEDWVSSVLAFVQDHPKSGVVSGKIHPEYLGTPSTAALKCEAALCRVDYGTQEIHFKPESPAIRFAGAAIVFQKQALLEIGWLEKQYLTDRVGKALSSGGDTEIILRIKNKGWEIWYTPTLYAVHLIPSTRTTIEYLCRLHRGIACTSAQLDAIGMEGKVPLRHQLKNLALALAFTARRIGAWTFHDLLLRRHLGDKRLVQIFEGIGRVESCISFFLNPLDVKDLS